MERISRRNFLKVAGVGAAALSLAACGGAASSTASSTASSAASAAAEDVTIKVAAIETGLRLPRCGRRSPRPLPLRPASRWN